MVTVGWGNSPSKVVTENKNDEESLACFRHSFESRTDASSRGIRYNENVRTIHSTPTTQQTTQEQPLECLPSSALLFLRWSEKPSRTSMLARVAASKTSSTPWMRRALHSL